MRYYPNDNNSEPNPNYIPPASVKKSSLIRISESDEWIVDYDRERGMYRVSYFEDGHFWDELWFDTYEDKEFSVSFPQTIGNMTYYSKADLFEWIETQQQLNKKYIEIGLRK